MRAGGPRPQGLQPAPQAAAESGCFSRSRGSVPRRLPSPPYNSSPVWPNDWAVRGPSQGYILKALWMRILRRAEDEFATNREPAL